MFFILDRARLATQLEAEMARYDRQPSKTELVRSLIVEGLAFRQMHRSPPRQPRRRRADARSRLI